ncbi:MAG: histidine kinase [Crocinitomicaceae bacterium]|nr:histidine kinase [Crocinitomicaceae bacterium]
MKYFVYIAFLVLSVRTSGSFAQSNSSYTEHDFQRDTLSKTVLQQKIKNARLLFERDSVIDVELLEEVLNQSVYGKYWLEMADAYLLLSEMNKATGQCENAIKNAKRANETYTSLNQSKGYFASIHILASCYVILENYDMAEQYYSTAITVCKKSDKEEELKLRLALGKLYVLTENSIAKSYLQDVQRSALDNNYFSIAAESEIELGNLEEQSGNSEGAKEYFNQAKIHAIHAKNNDLIFNSNLNLSNAYLNSNDDVNANLILNDASNYFSSTGDTLRMINTTLCMADQNVQIGNYTDAINQYTYSFTLSGATANLTTQTISAEKLYSVYNMTSARGSEAIKAYNNYMQLKDSLEKIKHIKQSLYTNNQIALNNVQTDVEVLEKQRKLDQQTIDLLEREKEVNESEIQNQRALIYVFGFLILAFAAAGFYIYRNNKARKRATQLLYLKSMRSQMNPHFIFNSLNSVNSFISQNNEREANKYLSRFAKLMRQILDQSESEFIPLSKEIEVLELYVQLEHERFRDTFEYTFEIDASIQPDLYEIPPMLVQPFVENAIWHGLRYKETGGQLKINFIDRGEFIEINVKDNGIGREASRRLKTKNQKQHQSAAMSIVENRTRVINNLFKTKIRFEIIDLPDERGTEVKVFVYPISAK